MPSRLTLALALPSAAHAAAKKPGLYVSLGDSYASGYQASGVGVGKKRATASPTRWSTRRASAVTG